MYGYAYAIIILIWYLMTYHIYYHMIHYIIWSYERMIDYYICIWIRMILFYIKIYSYEVRNKNGCVVENYDVKTSEQSNTKYILYIIWLFIFEVIL